MYLRGSNLSLRKKRRRGNPFLIILLTAGIAFLVYFNVVVAPTVNPPFVPTPTITRDPVSFEIEADALSAEGKFLAAIETYQAAINANPRNVDNYLKIARLQIYSSDYAQAQVNAENAILLNKSSADAFALLGWQKDCRGNTWKGSAMPKPRFNWTRTMPLDTPSTRTCWRCG